MRGLSKTLLAALACAIPVFAVGGGRVVGIVGLWTYGDGKPIHFGFPLEDDQDVICQESGSLTILLRNAEKPATLHCEIKGARTNIKDFADKNSHGAVSEFFSHLYDLVSIQFSREPKTYIAAVSRGFGNAEVDESVLLVVGKQVDVAPALATARAGKYSVAFFPLAEDVPNGAPQPVIWNPGTPARIGAPELQTGLLKMAIVSDGAPTSVAWVLLAEPGTFAHLAKSFADARDIVSKWPGGTHSQASRSVLRAYLQELASGRSQ